MKSRAACALDLLLYYFITMMEQTQGDFFHANFVFTSKNDAIALITSAIQYKTCRSKSERGTGNGCMTFGALLYFKGSRYVTFGAPFYFKESRYVTSGALNFDVQYRIHLRISIPVSLLTITERLATLQ